MTNDEIQAAYESAIATHADAQQKLADLKSSSATIIKALADAKAAYAGFKPSLTVAKAQLDKAAADVTITRAAWFAVAPNESINKKANTDLLDAVTAFLAGKYDGVSTGDIFASVGHLIGGENPRAGFTAYLSRWGTSGKLVNVRKGVWALPAGTVDQAFAPWVPVITPTNPVDDNLPADFPGLYPLQAAGFHTKFSLSGKTLDDLKAIAGIGSATAVKILEALSA